MNTSQTTLIQSMFIIVLFINILFINIKNKLIYNTNIIGIFLNKFIQTILIQFDQSKN